MLQAKLTTLPCGDRLNALGKHHRSAGETGPRYHILSLSVFVEPSPGSSHTAWLPPRQTPGLQVCEMNE